MSTYPNIPPMPQPKDFDITDDDWLAYSERIETQKPSAGIAKVAAYYKALEAWHDVMKSVLPK